MGTQRVQMKEILHWLVHWALQSLHAGTRDFYPALTALVSPVQNIFFIAVHYFNSFASNTQQAGQAVAQGCLSLNVCLWSRLPGAWTRWRPTRVPAAYPRRFLAFRYQVVNNMCKAHTKFTVNWLFKNSVIYAITRDFSLSEVGSFFCNNSWKIQDFSFSLISKLRWKLRFLHLQCFFFSSFFLEKNYYLISSLLI